MLIAKGLTMVKNLLRKMSILQLTLFSSAVLTLFILTLLIQNLSNKWSQANVIDHDVSLIELLDSLEKVAHNHAVERGLSAGFLGNGSQAAKQKVDAQRIKADQSITNLKSTIAGLDSEDAFIARSIDVLFQHESNKSEIRRKVDLRQGAGAFDFYSRLNKIAIDIAGTLKTQIKNNQLGNDLASAFLFAEYKERLGQRRGRVNGVLAKQSISASIKDELNFYKNELSLLNAYLSVSLSADKRTLFESILRSDNSKTINQISNQLTSKANVNFDSLPASSNWFPMATKQIGSVKTLLDQQWLQTKQTGLQLQQDARFGFYTTIAGFVISLIIIGIVNYHLIVSLRSELSQLTESLIVAEKGDLGVDVRLESTDELGSISRAIHNTLHAFRVFILGVGKSVSTGSELTNEMNTATVELLEDSSKTQSMATNIATAIEQMAATSVEIAESATKTLTASDDLNAQSQLLLQDNQKSQHSMTELAESMTNVETLSSQMEQQVVNITSILDTIRNVAEQTNLLALNAAIEAARAGESGRGFAVVADEVRSLAGSSKESSDKIAELLNHLQNISDKVVDSIKHNSSLTQTAIDDFARAREIADSVCQHITQVETLAMGVSTAAEQQSSVAANIAQDTAAVLDLANHEVEAAEKLEVIFKDMKINSDTLQRTMDNFKT